MPPPRQVEQTHPNETLVDIEGVEGLASSIIWRQTADTPIALDRTGALTPSFTAITMTMTMTMNISERNRANELLDKSLPTYRQAYSDRTAWLMACLSELAYLRFNPLFSGGKQEEWFIENISRLIDDGRKASLLKLIDSVAYDPEEERGILEESLNSLRLELSATFDRGGTQAILVSGESFIALAFRGTEAMSIRDIKADATANKRACESGGKIHSPQGWRRRSGATSIAATCAF